MVTESVRCLDVGFSELTSRGLTMRVSMLPHVCSGRVSKTLGHEGRSAKKQQEQKEWCAVVKLHRKKECKLFARSVWFALA